MRGLINIWIKPRLQEEYGEELERIPLDENEIIQNVTYPGVLGEHAKVHPLKLKPDWCKSLPSSIWR
ncbi:hypothetical protein [Jeotgalibacillus soli]|uniref:Uncharacterized protein n=1 Tax=Jeotgalibacillus soli TaxID=889306 RepID=A0A0C2SE03_9BACL|nr:hypothetical protein [Jeotgalibacillus soli]KIL52184.1 hypothetical protein KP78_05540 [Jeotgalibacillus soli]